MLMSVEQATVGGAVFWLTLASFGAAITALAFTYLRETSRRKVAIFYTAAALSAVAIVCLLRARPERKLQP